MARFKVTEVYPEATVRIIYILEAESEEELKNFQAEWDNEDETVDIDWGDSAYTESIVKIG